MQKNKFTGLNRFLKSESLQQLLNKIDDGTFSTFIDDWKWIFSYSKRYKKVIAFYLILGILSSTLGLVSSVVSKYLIDIIVGKKLDQLWVLVFMMVFSTVFSLVFSSVIGRLSLKISIDVGNDIQADIFSQIIDAKWLELNRYPNGDLLNRFNSDVSTVAGNAVSWGPSLILSVYNFIATFCVILYYDVTMAFIALGSAPFLLLMSRYIMRKNKEYRERVLQMNSKLMSFEVETFYNIDTIKSFGIMDKYGRELKKWQGKYKDHSLEYNLFQIKTGILTKLISTGVTFVAFGYCLFRMWSGAISYGTMTLFLQQRSALTSQFNSLVGIIPGMLNSSISAHRIREIVQLPKEFHNPEAAKQLDAVKDDGLTVRMKDVDFSYMEGQNVITDSDFVAQPGEIVALVGPSGEGKTTMLRLILGLISPQDGSVVLSGKDGREMDMSADVRQFFSYVPQGNTILSGTIAENLRMVKEDATDEEIIDALKTACAWDFVSRHPQGIGMNVGERGMGLSEGQAQRIAIARAVLRDAPILLMDEATSALDVTTERQVLRNIIKQHPNKTCIVTTHRPSVLNMCQRVYRVMETNVRELSEEESSRMAMDF
ncbi:MAG: ABC transporter ATP-binding protein [Ruminococcaceae bacterium]|nr:ABC transporter ATP-binding protein [Oscillospiraceae bacterium]